MHVLAYIHIKKSIRKGGSGGVLKGERKGEREEVKRQPSSSDDQHYMKLEV